MLILVLSLFGPAPSSTLPESNRAHPLLVHIAGKNPGQTVAIVVQKQAGGDRLEARVARLGGRVTLDLAIIDAFAAEMSAAVALDLARDPAVRWISLDAPMESTACTGECVSSILG